MWHFTVSYPPGAPYKGGYYISLRARGLCPLLTWPTLKTIRGTCRDRTAGRLTTGCWVVRLQVRHPWLILETSLVLRRAINWGRCLHLHCPKPIQKSTLGTGTDISWKHHSWLLTNEYSVGQEVTQWNAILFQLYYGPGPAIYRPVCLFPYIKLRWNYNPAGFANEAYQFPCKLWENCALTVQPVISYIYLCGRIHASCLSYISNHPSWIGQKLKCNTGIKRNHTPLALSNTDSWCLVPFNSDISCNHTHEECLCFGYIQDKKL